MEVPLHDFAHRESLSCANPHKERNEQEKEIPKETDKAKQQSHGLPNMGGDMRCSRIFDSSGQERPEHSTTIHREGGEHVKQDENYIQ